MCCTKYYKTEAIGYSAKRHPRCVSGDIAVILLYLLKQRLGIHINSRYTMSRSNTYCLTNMRNLTDDHSHKYCCKGKKDHEQPTVQRQIQDTILPTILDLTCYNPQLTHSNKYHRYSVYSLLGAAYFPYIIYSCELLNVVFHYIGVI